MCIYGGGYIYSGTEGRNEPLSRLFTNEDYRRASDFIFSVRAANGAMNFYIRAGFQICLVVIVRRKKKKLSYK